MNTFFTEVRQTLVPVVRSSMDRFFDSHIWPAMYVARYATPHMTSTGSLIFLSGTQDRQPALGLSLVSIVGHAIETLTENFALELAPIRVNTIACGFVDTPLSASLLGEGLQAHREELERTVPIHRVVQPEDVAKLAVSHESDRRQFEHWASRVEPPGDMTHSYPYSPL